MRKLLFCLLCLSINIVLTAKNPDWKLSLEKKVLKVEVSPDYSKMFIIDEGEDNLVLTCLNFQDGKILWTIGLPGLEEGQEVFCRFVDEKIIYAGRNNEHIFISADKGEVVKTIPLFCEEWDDVVWGGKPNPEIPDRIWESIFVDGLAVYFGSDGIQIIDLKNSKELYKNIYDSRTTSLLTQLNYKCFDIKGYGLVILDTKVRKVVLDKPNSEIRLSSRMKKPIILNAGYGTFVCDDEIKFYNLSTGEHISDFKVEPTDAEYLGAIETGGQLYMLNSMEETHQVIDIKSGKTLFATKPNTVPGYIETVIISDDKKYYLLIAYDNDDNIASLYKINSETIDVLWKKDLFEYDKKFEADFLNQSSASKFLTNVAIAALTMNTQATPGSYSRWQSQMENRRNAAKFWNSLLTDMDISIYKCSGYARTVSLDKDKITIACQGDITSLIEKIEDEDEQEFIATIELNNGGITKYTKSKIDDSPPNGEAIKTSKVEPLLNGISIFGKSNLYLIRDDKIEPFNFSEKKLTFLNNNGESLIFSTFDQDENIYDIYKLDVNEKDSKMTLLTQSEINNILYKDSYYNLPYSVKIDEDFISFYNPINTIANENVFTSPIAQISRDEFEIGNFNDYSLYNIAGFFHGINKVEGGFLISGSDAIGFISNDMKCKWIAEWPSQPFLKTTGIRFINGYVTYESDDKVGIIDKGCSGQYIFQQDFFPGYSLYLSIPDKSAIIITSKEDIQMFLLK